MNVARIAPAALALALAWSAGASVGTPAARAGDGLPSFLLRADHPDMSAAFAERASSAEEWADAVDRAGFDFLCLGETHSAWHRAFYADWILPRLRLDRLLIEESPAFAEEALSRRRAGEDPVMLGAPFGRILDAALLRNPEARVEGIEMTREQDLMISQEALSGRGRMTRDGFIGLNALRAIERGGRSVAVYGALHCARATDGLGFDPPFFRLLANELSPRGLRVANAKIVAPGEAPVLRAILSRYGLLRDRPIALSSLGDFAPALYNYRLELMSLFQSYDALLIAP